MKFLLGHTPRRRGLSYDGTCERGLCKKGNINSSFAFFLPPEMGCRAAGDFAMCGEAQSLMRSHRPWLSPSTRIPFPDKYLENTSDGGSLHLSEQPELTLDGSGCNIYFWGASVQGVSSPISQELCEGRAGTVCIQHCSIPSAPLCPLPRPACHELSVNWG